MTGFLDGAASPPHEEGTGVWPFFDVRLGNAAAPLLGQGGVAAPSSKWPRSFERRGRGGLFKRMAVHRRFGQAAPATTLDGSSLIRPQALRRPGDSRTGQPLCRTVRNTGPFGFIYIGDDFVMRLTVQFDNQPAFRAVKVDNVRTYAMLPSKLFTLELSALQMFPQRCLSCSTRIPQFHPF